MPRCIFSILVIFLLPIACLFFLACASEYDPDCPEGFERVDQDNDTYVCKEILVIPDIPFDAGTDSGPTERM